MLQVHVESTFNEGMVVSYTDRETGIDYIGALLPKTPQSCLLTRKRKSNIQFSLHSAESQFANPLTCVHDHQYMKSLSSSVNGMLKNIPKKTLLTWGTCDSQLSSVRCRSTELSSQTSTPKTFVALCDDPCIRSDSADLLDFDGTYYRSAKQTAYERLKVQREFESLNKSFWSSFEQTQRSSSRKKRKSQSKIQSQHQSLAANQSVPLSYPQSEVCSSHNNLNSSGSNLSEESHDFTSSLSVTKLNDIRHLDDLDGYRPESQQQSIVQLNSDMSSPKPRLLQLKPFSLKLAKVTDNFQKDSNTHGNQ